MNLRQFLAGARRHRRRILRLSAPFWLVIIGRALLGCSDSPKTVARSAPLAPIDLAQKHREALEKKRLTNAQGELLPSDDSIAGLLLPRGLTRTHAFEHAWYYRTQASIEQLTQFFGTRLLTGKVERGGRGTVTYVDAQPRGLKKTAFVTVRIGPAPGGRAMREVYVKETPMMPVAYPSEAEAQAKLLKLQRYAD